jgi:flagellin FlaB
MRKGIKNEDAFTGLEAAIVLIAFVVVAAVFSYVVLGAGFFTTQKSQETVYKGVEQATANIQMVGNMYGLVTGGSTAGITEIKFTIGLAPGSPTVDLTKMTILFSTTDTGPITLTRGTSASVTQFTTKLLDSGSGVESMKAQEQVTIDFKVVAVPKNTVMNIELRPAVGAALPFSKTTPPKLETTNILY